MADRDVLERYRMKGAAPSVTYRSTALEDDMAAEILTLRAQLARLQRGTEHREPDGGLAADTGGEVDPANSSPVPEPRGCAMPGCCAAVDDISRLRERTRVLDTNPALTSIIDENATLRAQLATAEDEAERRWIPELCSWCDEGEAMPRRGLLGAWLHAPYVECLASPIYEKRYQDSRQRDERQGGEDGQEAKSS